MFRLDRNKILDGLILIALIVVGGLYYFNKPKSYQERLEEEIARINNLKSKLTKDCQMKLAVKAIEETFGKEVTYEIKKTNYYILSEYVGNSTADGTIKASAGSFTGTITANSGTIANWRIGSNELSTLTAYNKNGALLPKVNGVQQYRGVEFDEPKGYGMYFGSNGLRIGSNFKVSNIGNLTVSANADIKGKITATTGSLGGWTIGSNYLYCGSGRNNQNLSNRTSDNAIVQIGDNYATNAPYIDQNLQGQIYLGSSGIFYGNKFVVNSNGSLYCTDAHIVGDIYARNGYFAGTVYASGGKFSGELDATSGKFDSLRGTQFTFVSGEIQSSVKISGALDVNGNRVEWRSDDVMIGLTS